MKQILIIIGFIMLLGLLGRMEYTDTIATHKQDEINKQEVIKDIELRCMNGELTGEMCKGL